MISCLRTDFFQFFILFFPNMNHDIDPRSLLPINQRRQRTTYSPDADPNEIIGWRNTSRRTSWRNRHLSLNVNNQRELRLLRSWYNNLIDLLPIATNQCYTLYLIVFLVSKNNPHLRSFFQLKYHYNCYKQCLGSI